jgi:choline kinase
MTEPICKKAVILAAGVGSRIRSLTTGRPKCLMDLGGRPIIEWIFDALRAGGIEEVVMVTGFKAQILRRALGSGSNYDLRLRYVHNPRWTEPNGISLQAARRALRPDDTFLTLMSDHLLPASIIRTAAGAVSAGCILVVDTRVSKVLDLSDATKVRITDGVPVAIGKRLRKYNAVDCGLFRFDRRVFAAMESAIGSGRKSLTEAVRILIEDGDLDVLPIGGGVSWIDIDTPRAYRQAKRMVHRLAAGSEGKYRPGRTGWNKRQSKPKRASGAVKSRRKDD